MLHSNAFHLPREDWLFLKKMHLQESINSKRINMGHDIGGPFCSASEDISKQIFYLEKEVHTCQDADTGALRLALSYSTRQLLRRETRCSAVDFTHVWFGLAKLDYVAALLTPVLNRTPVCSAHQSRAKLLVLDDCLILFKLMVSLLPFISIETRQICHSFI